MQSPKIDSHLSPVPYSNWVEKICYWLGRVWSFCFAPCGLAQRVDKTASKRFTEDESDSDVDMEKEIEELLNAILPGKNEIEEPEQLENPPEVISLKPEEKSKPPVSPKKEEPSKAAGVEKKTKTPYKRVPKPQVKPTEEKIKQSATAAAIVKPKAASTTYKLINNPGKGACQLYAILEGLKRQYPDKLKYLENGKTVILTHEILRKLGIDFICNQIDSCGPYAKETLEYLDTDRKEFNKSIKPKNHVLSDENFLKLLKRSDFACSTSHLFALSTLFNLPIYVHDKEREIKGEKAHAIQMFTPEGCKLEPIHLWYQPKEKHYQYMLFPK